MTPTQALRKQGQALWLDFIERDLYQSGKLDRLIREDKLRGLTSNPAIFEKAIAGGNAYDDTIRDYLSEHPRARPQDVFEALAVEDIQHVADRLRGVYDETDGADGYVSFEVAPGLAHDTKGTVEEARRLWKSVGRPNLMIKVPATPAGLPAVETLISEGINVNITLMFSMDHYEAVAAAYIRGLERAERVDRIHSVASFFISRVDSMVDDALEAIGTEEARSLLGRIGIANAKLVYQRFKEIFHGTPFEALRARGAHVQRPLWASTSTKNPAYRDVMYVEALIGPETVNTVPPETLEAFRDHGNVAGATIEQGLDEARREIERLGQVGIDLDEVTEALQKEGVEKFSKPFDSLMETLAGKSRALAPSVA